MNTALSPGVSSFIRIGKWEIPTFSFQKLLFTSDFRENPDIYGPSVQP